MSEHFSIILNPKSNLSHKVIEYFNSSKIDYIRNDEKEKLIKILQKKIKAGCIDFIICGGDGTINNFINTYMQLPPKIRVSLKIGFLPCGKANDLVRELNIPFDIKSAFKQILRKRIKEIDLIKINNSYFLTGGGLGLPTETVKDVELFSSKNVGKMLTKKLRNLIYLLFVIKKMFFGYGGIESTIIKNQYKNKKNLMLISVQNQSFIGKRFMLAPNADNCDGFFEICIIEKPNNIISNLLMLHKIVRGKHLDSKGVFQYKTKKVLISTKKANHFMADGELLCYSNTFKIEIVPHAIKVYY